MQRVIRITAPLSGKRHPPKVVFRYTWVERGGQHKPKSPKEKENMGKISLNGAIQEIGDKVVNLI